jgi:hypothetical protein
MQKNYGIFLIIRVPSLTSSVALIFLLAAHPSSFKDCIADHTEVVFVDEARAIAFVKGQGPCPLYHGMNSEMSSGSHYPSAVRTAE